MTILLQGLTLFQKDEVTHIIKIITKIFHSNRTTVEIKLFVKATWFKINLMVDFQNIIHHPKIILIKGI